MADHSTSGRDGTTRRSALRSLAATATAITAGVGVANAGEDPSPFHDPVDAPKLPYPDKTVFTYDNSLRKITSQAYLLALSEKAIDRHFDTSNLEGREFERARQYVRNLRKRYPTRTVERDEETVFELSHEARRNLHLDRRSGRPLAENASPSGDRPSPSNGGVPSQQCDADRDALEATIQAFSGTGDSLEQSNTDVGIQWNPGHHPTMLETITGNLDATGNFQDWAAKPDEFSSMANGMLGLKDGNLGIQSPIPNSLGVDAVEDALGSALQSVINVLGNNYAQFYQPSIFSLNTPIIDDIEVGDIGMAPEAAQLFYESADMFSGGSYNNRKYAAYASHYLQDMGNPLHTGMALEQAGVVLDVDIQTDYNVPTGIRIDTNFSSPNRWLHYGYEQLVKNEWEHNLEIDFTGWYAPPIDDGADAVRSVANETHQYADDIFHTIYENESGGRSRYPSNWSSNTRDEALEGISNCLTVTGRYNRSLLLDVGIGERPDCPYLGC